MIILFFTTSTTFQAVQKFGSPGAQWDGHHSFIATAPKGGPLAMIKSEYFLDDGTTIMVGFGNDHTAIDLTDTDQVQVPPRRLHRFPHDSTSRAVQGLHQASHRFWSVALKSLAGRVFLSTRSAKIA